jgi:hypothetical protein
MVVSAAELGEIVGIDLATVNNWLRRRIITRAHVGGRQLRNRLFSTDEVYKVALTKELVGLGIAPSLASHAVSDLWKEWQRSELQKAGNVFAALMLNDRKSLVISWWQKRSGGLLRQLVIPSELESAAFELSRQAFAVVPISGVVAQQPFDTRRQLAERLSGHLDLPRTWRRDYSVPPRISDQQPFGTRGRLAHSLSRHLARPDTSQRDRSVLPHVPDQQLYGIPPPPRGSYRLCNTRDRVGRLAERFLDIAAPLPHMLGQPKQDLRCPGERL